MEERQLAENIIKTVGSSLFSESDYTLSGNQIAERYKLALSQSGYNILEYDDCIRALQHFVYCAGYKEGVFEYYLSDYVI